MERQLITQSAGAGFHETDDLDDSLHYQGHSQIQHSQVYSQHLMEGLDTPRSLAKLTPMHPSQIISQVQIGQISVDDDDDVPVRDGHKPSFVPVDDDSPFLHLSDNLSRHSSKSKIQSQLSDSSLDQVVTGTGTRYSQNQDSSQMSYLGLGVRHASDLVMTNTASLMEDGDTTGLSTLGLEGSTASRLRHCSTIPLLPGDNILDDTPVREKPSVRAVCIPQTSGKSTNFALLTSLSSDTDTPVKDTPGDQDPEELQGRGSPVGATMEKSTKKLSLGAMTSLPSKLESHRERLSSSVEVASQVPEGPERQRSSTLAGTTPAAFSRMTRNTKLGKLTSLDYIRASLRKKLNSIKSKENRDKKPLKSAMRKANSISSTSSNESTPSHHSQSLTYVNRYTHYDDFNGRDISPHPLNYPPFPPQMTSPDMMVSPDMPVFPGGAGYMGGAVPYNGREPYGYSGPPQLSPALGYGQELSPILSVPFDYHDPQYSRHEIGILPPYGGPIPAVGDYQEQFPIPAASQYDDEDLPVLGMPYRHPGQMGGGPSQGQSQRVTWNLDHEEIPPRTPVDPEELTPSDIDIDD